MEFLSQLTAVDVATLSMSALALIGGAISTVITTNAKYYEDQRQLRMVVGDLAQKILALRAEDDLLNVKALRNEIRTEEFALAHANNLRSQKTLARLMMDTLEQLKHPASPTEYELLGSALTANSDAAGDKYWRLAIARTTDTPGKRAIINQFAYALIRYGRHPEGERAFKEAVALAGGDPIHEGYAHETRARALHAARRLDEASAAFDEADASYGRIVDPGTRDWCRQALASARATVGLARAEPAKVA
jgi:hypothetical protein